MSVDEIPLYLNPTAGRGRARRMATSIVAEFRDCGVTVKLIESAAEQDLEEKVRRAASAGSKTILVAGGDGSVHEAVNGILSAGKESKLGIIPIGTGNDFAKAINISLDWRVTTRTIAKKILQHAPERKIDIGQMNGRYFANGAGIGFDAKINMLAKKYRWPTGDLVYLLAVFEGLWDGVITPTVRIRGSNYTYDGNITLANISNGAWVGGIFHIAPMARVDDGKLDLVLADPLSRTRILGLIPKLLRGTHIGTDAVTHLPIEELSLTSSAPIPSHLDGESQPLQSDFDIRVLQNALRII